MMSSLFEISVQLVAGSTAWARVEVCHPDQWSVPSTKTFALLVVVEAYHNLREYSGFIGRQPLWKSDAAAIIAQHPLRSKLEEWLELYRKFDAPPFTVAADAAIADVKLVNEQDNPKQDEDGPWPKATVEFTVSDPAIIAHLRGGIKFHSAMIDCYLW